MTVKKYTQAQQVIDTLRAHGGYATLGNLYHLVDTSTWATKTPNESIRRIVQQSEEIFRIQPGLWALEECRDEVMRKFEIKTEAAKISRSYINVPVTTDFAIMFLPTEGLYAEVLRRPGLIEEIQRKYSIMICGPTTISAFLNTLRVGFRTIAIDKQQAEVWKILGAAKQQYEMFEAVLDKAERKISEAGSVIGDAKKRNGIIQKKLRAVESTPDENSGEILGIE